MVAAKRKRYRGGYVEDPELGHSVDVSNISADILNDPMKLLDWLSNNEDSPSSTLPELPSSNDSGDKLPGRSAFEVRKSFYDHDEDNQCLPKAERDTSNNARIDNRDSGVGSVNWELSYLSSRGIEYVDNRAKGGTLWVMGDYSIAVEIGYLRSCGMSFHFKKEGSSATNHNPAWWTKSATPTLPADLTEIEAHLHDSPVDSLNGSVASLPAKEQEVDALFTTSELAPLAAPELLGILIGITCDGKINELEAKTLLSWLESVDEEKYGNLSKVKKLLEQYLADDVIDEEEEKALLSLFKRIMDLADGLDSDVSPEKTDVEEVASSTDGDIQSSRPEVEAIRKLGCKCIDLRDEGGALWILGGSWVQKQIATLRQMGLRFSYSAKGSVATGFTPGWWTRDEFSNKSEFTPKSGAAAGGHICSDREEDGKPCAQSTVSMQNDNDHVALCDKSLARENDPLNKNNAEREPADSQKLFGRDMLLKSGKTYRNIRLAVTDRSYREHTILSNNVLFMKANGTYTSIYTCDSRVVEARCGLHSMEMKLHGEGFIRPNRSYLISINQVKSIEEQDNGRFYIYMNGRDDGIPVHLSRMNMIYRYFDPSLIIRR